MALKWMLGTATAALIAASPALAQTSGSELGACALGDLTSQRFSELDGNGDGALTMEEYRECLSQAGIEPDEQQVQSVETAFDEADADSDDRLVLAEVESYGQQQAGNREDVGEEGRPEGTITVTQPAADVTVRQPAPEVNVTQQAPEVEVEPQAPEVAVETPRPEVNVTQPEPQVAVTQPEPDVTVTQPEPEIAVTQPQPDVEVQPGQPAVAVDAAQPEVAVATPEPEVAVEQPELDVNVEQAQPDVAVEQAQPEVAVRRSGSAEVQTETAAASSATTTDVTAETAADAPQYQIALDDIVGEDIYNPDGDKIGSVENVVLRATDQTAVVIVEVGGFLGIGGKELVVPYEDLNVGGDRIVLNSAMSKDEFQEAMPEYDETAYQPLPDTMIVR